MQAFFAITAFFNGKNGNISPFHPLFAPLGVKALCDNRINPLHAFMLSVPIYIVLMWCVKISAACFAGNVFFCR
jgi:hypothetical protein